MTRESPSQPELPRESQAGGIALAYRHPGELSIAFRNVHWHCVGTAGFYDRLHRQLAFSHFRILPPR